MTTHEERAAAQPFRKANAPAARRYRTAEEWKTELQHRPHITQKVIDGKLRYCYVCSFSGLFVESALGLPGYVIDGERGHRDEDTLYGRFKDVCCMLTWAHTQCHHYQTLAPDLLDRVTRYCKSVLRDDLVPMTPPVKYLRGKGGNWTTREWESEYERLLPLPKFFASQHYHLRAAEEKKSRMNADQVPIDVVNAQVDDALREADLVGAHLSAQLASRHGGDAPVGDFSVASSSSSSPSPSQQHAKRKQMSSDGKTATPKKQKAAPMKVDDFESFCSQISQTPKPAKQKKAAAPSAASSVVAALAPKQKKKPVLNDDPILKQAKKLFEAEVAKKAAADAAAAPKANGAAKKKNGGAAAAVGASSSSAAPARTPLPSAKHQISVKRGGKCAVIDSSNVFADLGKLLYSDGMAPAGVQSVFIGVLDSKGVLTLSNANGSFKITVAQ